MYLYIQYKYIYIIFNLTYFYFTVLVLEHSKYQMLRIHYRYDESWPTKTVSFVI